MAFLIDSLKEKFDFSDEDYDFEGFNYVVGNTSGMDVTADIPSEIAERVGQLAQRGGSVMEIKLENPTTFYIDRKSLYDTIEGLGLDVSFHSDPNIGYTSSYKTGRGRGFDITQDYFTKYLQNFASFKKEAEEREDLSFDIQRINPHVSTDQLPPLHERMADDVSLDPFGYKISELSEEVMRRKSERGKNIFDNKEFLRRLYHTFLLEEVDYDFQYYNLFARYSNKFEDRWEEARRDATNQYYTFKTDPENEDVGGLYESLEAKISVIRTAQTQDRGIETEWFSLLEDHGDFKADIVEVDFSMDNNGNLQTDNISETTAELNVSEILEGSAGSVIGLQALPRIMYQLKKSPEQVLVAEGPQESFVRIDPPQNMQPQMRQAMRTQAQQIAQDRDIFERNVEPIQKQVIEALDELWKGNGEEKMSIDAKIGALNSHFDVQQMKIQELAYELDDDIEEDAEQVLMGEDEYFEKKGPEEDMQLNKHQELLRNLISANFEQQIWMESNIFYRVVPAWMSVAGKEYEGHDGFTAPEYIWNTTVERKWGDKYDLDMTDPRAEEGGDPKFLDLLEENREFRMDVAAASAAVYFWSHFTQVDNKFKIEGNQYVPEDEGEYTWIEWMNKYGLGVNMEAMAGSSNEMFKIWRPKDIVTACRAVNMTAREKLDEIHEDLDGGIAKFTIDMEHTASFGVEPWGEMELLIDQEKWLAGQSYNVQVDKDKPLAYIVRMYHLTSPGWETSQGAGHTHGPFRKGDVELYEWLYDMFQAGFGMNPGEEAYVMYEVGGEQAGTVFQAEIATDLIELDVAPDDLDPSKVDPDSEYRDEKEALMARFFRMDRPNFTREWAKIEEHAFDPLDGLLQAEGFDYTWSGSAAIEQGGNRPNEWKNEEFR
ncbi:MAG: hypothetical protein ABEJ87_04670 [Candidatus Nanohalobium sp.]